VAVGEKDEPAKEITPWGRKVIIPIRSLKSLVSQYNIDQIDFLKIDVEGAEIEVLKSLEGVKVNFIAMEYHGKERKNRAEEMLKKMGFKVISLDEEELGYIFAVREMPQNYDLDSRFYAQMKNSTKFKLLFLRKKEGFRPIEDVTDYLPTL